METQHQEIQAPPRLLLGAALLFWGAMSDHPLLGLGIALLVESANWTRFRWNFDDQACTRAWKLTLALILVSGTLIWLDGDRYTAVPRLLLWLPPLLLPLQFVQSFGIRNWMPLNSFSFFTRLHRERNLKLGLPESVIRFNFGNVYFIAILISAALGRNAGHFSFLPGMVLLSGCLLFAKMRRRPVVVMLMLGIGGWLALAGQNGLREIYDWATDTSYVGGYPKTNPNENRTSIGSLGEIKQSQEMHWRLRPEEGTAPPRLLRTAVYNRYRGVTWEKRLPADLTEEETMFRDLDTIELVEGEVHYLLKEGADKQTTRPELPLFHMKGAARNETLLPLPANAATLGEFELVGIEINPLGTVRIFPKRSIIDGTVKWRDQTNPEGPPYAREDLQIPEQEQEIIREVADQLGLADLPTVEEKLLRLRQWFGTEFEYTRYLSMPRALPGRRSPASPIGLFLTVGKRGHCEYFATSAALLLRAADVPTRYHVGFSVLERDPKRNEFVIRGIHGHSWCGVWDEARQLWIDFDPTPPGWLAAETGQQTATRRLADAYQRFKEDFFLWRNRPVNRLAATVVMWSIGLGVFAYVAKRLWKSKLEVARATSTVGSAAGHRQTPLHRLEKPAGKLLGPRPPGLTFANWLGPLSDGPLRKDQLDEALALHQRLRFDPEALPESALSRLRDLAGELDASLRHARSKSR